MKIETFEVSPCDELNEAVSEANIVELVSKLGLVGQQKLIDPTNLTYVQYKRLTRLDFVVYETLFPDKTKLQAFDAEIIPVKILELIDKVNQQKLFIKLEIWHSSYYTDPLLIGITGHLDPQSWNQEYIRETGHYLIARWGDSLAPFSDLCKKAKELHLAKKRATLTKDIKERQLELSTLEETTERLFLTGEAY